MKTSIATVCLSGNLAEKLSAIAQARFDGVEIFEMDFVAFDHTPREVGRMVRDAGLAITLFQPFRDFEGLPEPLRAKAFDRAERKFDVMQELGAELMLVCSSVHAQALGGVDRAAADFHELGARAAARGLRIGYEALAWGRYVNDHRDAWEIVRRAGHPSVGLILDSFHTLARNIDVTSIQSIPKEKIFIVQLADAPRLDMDYLSWSRHFRSMPGQGDLPLVPFVKAVRATGYDGYLSLEIFNDQFRAGSARQVALDGKRSLLHLADQGDLGAARLPARARCEGIEFIEFAVDGADVAELESVIGALGFEKRGTHRSKEVALWRQNDINIVVNTEHEGFAHASYVTHGPSVCALCLRVADAAAAVRRAQALLAKPFHQAVGAGELEIPAVRGVGGSLIYFVDGKSRLGDLWDVDFVPVGAQPPAEKGGLVAIDHVSQSMVYDEMLSWLLFYTSILDVTKTPELDIADPGGLVRSQVVASTDGALRIVLNGSQSQRTQSARFLTEFFGSGVQHIAFAASDIFAVAARLQAAGLETLPIPANYYDDLGGRFDLDPALIERMRRHGILYDTDGGGDYFQIYTRTVAGRFFFEIVERRGYAGLGAPNAAIRLAAQAREAEAASMT